MKYLSAFLGLLCLLLVYLFFASVSTLAFIEVNENTGLVVEDVTVLDTTTVYELKFVGSLNSIQVKSNNPTLYAKGDTLRLLD